MISVAELLPRKERNLRDLFGYLREYVNSAGYLFRIRRNRLVTLVALGVVGLCPLHASEFVSQTKNISSITDVQDIQSIDVIAAAGGIGALVVGKFGNNREEQAYFLLSADFGMTWRKPIRVNPPGTVVASSRGNDAQLAMAGSRLAAVWQRKDALPGSGAMDLAYSSDGGRHWMHAKPTLAQEPASAQSYFDLASDRRGRFHLVWLDDREENGNTQGLRYAWSPNGGRGWKAAGTIDGSVCTCCWNKLLALQDGSLAVLYRDSDPHDMNLAILEPKGAKWMSQGPVGEFNWQFQGCPHCGGGLTETRRGSSSDFHSVIWTGEPSSAGIYYLNSPDRGRHWTLPHRLADGHSREPDIATLADGQLGVVYSAPGTNGGEIRFTASTDGGKHWSEPIPLSNSARDADHPQILSTAAGFRVFWTERQGQGPKDLAMAKVVYD